MTERVMRQERQVFTNSEDQEQNIAHTENLLNWAEGNAGTAPQATGARLGGSAGSVSTNSAPAPTFDSSKAQGTQNFYQNQVDTAEHAMDMATRGSDGVWESTPGERKDYQEQLDARDKYQALLDPINVKNDMSTQLAEGRANNTPLQDYSLELRKQVNSGQITAEQANELYYQREAQLKNPQPQLSGAQPTTSPGQHVPVQTGGYVPGQSYSTAGSTATKVDKSLLGVTPTTIKNSSVPVAAVTNTSVGDSALSGNQRSLVSNLEQAAAGNAPSLASAELQRGVEAGRNSLMGALGSQRGSSPLSGLRGKALDNIALQTAGAAGKAAEMKVGEQQQARQELAGVLQGARSQDQATQQLQANLDFQTKGLNLNRDLAGQQDALSRDLSQGKITADEFSQRSQQLSQAASQDAEAANRLNELFVDQGSKERIAQLDTDTRIVLANLEAQLRSEGMDNDQIRFYLATKIAQDESAKDKEIQFANNTTNIAQGNAVAGNNAPTLMDQIQQGTSIGKDAASVVGSFMSMGAL